MEISAVKLYVRILRHRAAGIIRSGPDNENELNMKNGRNDRRYTEQRRYDRNQRSFSERNSNNDPSGKTSKHR